MIFQRDFLRHPFLHIISQERKARLHVIPQICCHKLSQSMTNWSRQQVDGRATFLHGKWFSNRCTWDSNTICHCQYNPFILDQVWYLPWNNICHSIVRVWLRHLFHFLLLFEDRPGTAKPPMRKIKTRHVFLSSDNNIESKRWKVLFAVPAFCWIRHMTH